MEDYLIKTPNVINGKKLTPLAVDDFQTIIERKCFYVDKSLFIKEFLNSGTDVNLITRPRRFGKTLNLSLLEYFFRIPKGEESTKWLFEDLVISKDKEMMHY